MESGAKFTSGGAAHGAKPARLTENAHQVGEKLRICRIRAFAPARPDLEARQGARASPRCASRRVGREIPGRRGCGYRPRTRPPGDAKRCGTGGCRPYVWILSGVPWRRLLGGRLELALQPGLAVDALEGLEDLELAVGLGFADVDVLGEVHVRLCGDSAARTRKGEP